MNVQTLDADELAPPPTVINAEASRFQENFNRASFQFAHNLAGHPLFELSRLLELSKTIPDTDVYYDAGDVRVNQRWDQVPRTQLSIPQLIERIENAGAWILLKRTNRDPQYAAVLDQLLSEAGAMVGTRFPKKMTLLTLVILITSPNRVTSYHMDPDCNFLCQIRGEKILHVFDKYDREVLPEQELERFWAKDKNAAIYKEQYQDRAKSYHLKPGMGVHIPVNCPHWVKNDDNISITLAPSFQFLQSELGSIYRWNYWLRRVGINPLPPGRSKVRDSLKSWTMGCAVGARNACQWVLQRKR
jgi:hypothetical protein